METTVEAEAVQADAGTEGHHIAVAGTGEITVTVTSGDGSRTRVYRVAIGETGPAVT